MKRKIGIAGTIILLLSITLCDPCLIVYARGCDTQANELIIDTETLPELLTYEELCKLYSCKDDIRVIDPAIIEVDQEDAVRLMKISQSEAGEDDPLAIAYVMMVVVNRWKDEYWPDTIEEVITQNKQFSSYKNGRYKKAKPSANAHYALYLVESGQINIESEYFESTSVKNSWQSKHRTFEFEYGGHRFYK